MRECICDVNYCAWAVYSCTEYWSYKVNYVSSPSCIISPFPLRNHLLDGIACRNSFISILSLFQVFNYDFYHMAFFLIFMTSKIVRHRIFNILVLLLRANLMKNLAFLLTLFNTACVLGHPVAFSVKTRESKINRVSFYSRNKESSLSTNAMT